MTFLSQEHHFCDALVSRASYSGRMPREVRKQGSCSTDLISDHGDCLDSLDSLSETDKGEVEKFEGTDYECPAEEA